jgi:signal transduction histidine kinase
MKIQQVFVIGMRDDLRDLLAEASRLAVPGAELTSLENFSQTKTRPADERGIFILVEPAPSLVAGTKTALDSSGLAHWPTVVLSEKKPEAGVEWVEPADWNARLVARVMMAAAEKHGLARENVRLKGDLLTISRRVNHDLRSSLNGVVTASEVIKEIFLTDKPEDVELIQPVADSAAEISRLMEQVSFVAKATAGETTPQKLPMDELVWKGLSRVERRIRERNARVTHVETWPVVYGVGPWIETVWTSLLLNALDHGGEPPEITIAWSESDTSYRFSVEDRGPGVPPEKRAALFTPFHRLTESGALRGFGLSVVQRLLELQDAGYGYEPREGGGARFYFTLRKPGD